MQQVYYLPRLCPKSNSDTFLFILEFFLFFFKIHFGIFANDGLDSNKEKI